MTENKRFVITKSNIIEEGWFIDDTVGNFSFGTTKDKSSLVMYEKQLNELNDENEELKSKYSEQCIQLDFLKAENKHMKEVLDENEQFRNIARDYNIPFNKLCSTFEGVLEENEKLKKDLKESQKLKNKRLRRVKNQRAVIEEIGGVIIGYKSQLRDLHYKIDKIKEAMEDTGALTKRQLEEILK